MLTIFLSKLTVILDRLLLTFLIFDLFQSIYCGLPNEFILIIIVFLDPLIRVSYIYNWWAFVLYGLHLTEGCVENDILYLRHLNFDFLF
jgi:hypothetical protein